MPRISDDTIQRVADASDVVDVIGSYLQLKRAGAMWKGLCPFHNEKTPSFTVNPSRQTFKCFGCGEGGTVFSFVMKYEHVDFPTAIRKLAARAGIAVAEESAGDTAKRGERDRLLAMQRDAAAWFHENLLRQKFAAHAREYLKARGVNSEIAVRWQLGFAPESWDALIGVLHERGYRDDEILKSGLVSVKDGERGGFYDRFRNRVMFPIRNDVGEVVAFSGRTLGDDSAKYVNSSETQVFTKGKVLFGLDKSKRAIIDKNEVIVCEGQIDLISIFEAGIHNVVAPQGTAFTEQQAQQLRRIAENVILCFDADAAGIKAAERSVPALLSTGINVLVAKMPAGEDPDSYIRKNGSAHFRKLLSAAPPFFDFILDHELPNTWTPEDKTILGERLAGLLGYIDDALLRETSARRVSIRLEVPFFTFEALVSARRANPRALSSERRESHVVQLNLSEAAILLCRVALKSLDARLWMRSQKLKPWDSGQDFQLVEKIIASDVDLGTPASFSTFLATLSPPEERAVLALNLDFVDANPLALVQESWQGMERQRIAAQIETLRNKMARDMGLEEAAALHKQILDLQNRLRHL
jgi:DNA primase